MDYELLKEILPKQPNKWGISDTETWLNFIGLSSIVPVFIRHRRQHPAAALRVRPQGLDAHQVQHHRQEAHVLDQLRDQGVPGVRQQGARPKFQGQLHAPDPGEADQVPEVLDHHPVPVPQQGDGQEGDHLKQEQDRTGDQAGGDRARERHLSRGRGRRRHRQAHLKQDPDPRRGRFEVPLQDRVRGRRVHDQGHREHHRHLHQAAEDEETGAGHADRDGQLHVSGQADRGAESGAERDRGSGAPFRHRSRGGQEGYNREESHQQDQLPGRRPHEQHSRLPVRGWQFSLHRRPRSDQRVHLAQVRTWLRLSAEGQQSQPHPLSDGDYFKVSAGCTYSVRVTNGRKTEKQVPTTCVKCETEQKNAVLLPCKHNVVCYSCSQQVAECPHCNVPIEERLKIFG